MTEIEARRCAALLRERWSEEQLRLEIEAPSPENEMRHVLRLILPQSRKRMRMLYTQQLPAAMDKLAATLGEGRSQETQKRPFQRRSGASPAKRATPPRTVSEPVPPGGWKHGDACEVAGRHDGPFTFLAMVDHDTLLCRRLDGRFFYCRAHLTRRIVNTQAVANKEEVEHA